jgi:hypothetical protein
VTTSTPGGSTRVVALLSWLLDAACEELGKTPSGPVGARLIAPGASAPPADWCCQTDDGLGMAWVRVSRRYRSTRFPVPESEPGACAAQLAVECELGVYRCVATLGDHGEPPSPVEVTADALAADADACALADAVGRLRWTHVRGAWSPIGPSGGCGGGAQMVVVAVGQGPIGT